MAGIAGIPESSRPAGRGITIGTPRLYEVLATVTFLGRRRAHFRTLLSAGRAEPGNRVLDVGSGTGYLARMLATTVGERGSVEGIDAAPEMVAWATRKARHLPNCRFREGTAESLPYADGSFDLVVCNFVIRLLPLDAQVPALREMRRVLRPGGSLLVTGAPMRCSLGVPMPPLDGLLGEAGFTEVQTGEVGRLIRYARGRSPVGSAPVHSGCETDGRASG